MVTDLSEYDPYQDGKAQRPVLLHLQASCLRWRCPSCLMPFVKLPPIQQSHKRMKLAPVSLDLKVTMGQSQAK